MNDLSKCCRVCLLVPHGKDILDLQIIYDEEEHLTYYECFMIVTSVDLMAGVNLPHKLCKACGLELQMAYDFHKKVQVSKQTLEDYETSPDSLKKEKSPKQQRFEEELEQREEQQSEQLQLEEVDSIDCSDPAMQLEVEKLDEEEFITISGIDLEAEEETVETMDGASSVEGQDEFILDEHEIYVPPNDEYNVEVTEMETEQTKTQIKSYEEIYTLETFEVEVDKPQNDTSAHPTESQPLWQQALVAVANNSYLPVKKKTTSAEIINENSSEEVSKTESMDDDDDGSDYEEEQIMNTYENGATDRKKRKHFKGKFSCDFCQKEFPNHSRMSIHRRSHLTDRPKFQCNLCYRSYNSKQALGIHVRTAHTKEGFNCPICGKVYAIDKSLEVHMRYHNGVFPFECDLCDKKFAQKSHLTTHKKIKHDNVRFVCEYPDCDKIFTSSAALRNHECKHGYMPFQCEFCSNQYPAKAKLKAHIMRTHGKAMTIEELERMRKYHVLRSKPQLVKVVEIEED